jgi:6,7-dimethyl-8-ribityllumazine synthase
VTPAALLKRQVPGAYELPYGAKCLIESSNVDAVIAVGCLIKGETMHFEYIAEAVTQVNTGCWADSELAG